jgi:hypothetical protein
MELSQFHELMVREINYRQANPEPIEYTPQYDLWLEMDRLVGLIDNSRSWREEEKQFLVRLAACAYLFMREIDEAV